MIGHTRNAGVDIGTAKIFRPHHFTGRSLYQRWTAEKDSALIATITDSSDIAGTYAPPAVHRAHDDRDLRDAPRRQVAWL